MAAVVTSMDSVETPLLGVAKKASGFFEITLAALRISSSPVIVPSTGVKVDKKKGIYTLDEISYHDQPDDCWVIIYDRVYDVTEFLSKHPGGSEVLLEYAGRDASMAFRGVGHSLSALKSLEVYKVGGLPPHECIFRTATGLRLSGIPD